MLMPLMTYGEGYDLTNMLWLENGLCNTALT